MLTILDAIPQGLVDIPSRGLHTVLPGPTLIHLPGRRQRPLFVCVLLHGNEDSGFRAAQAVLRKYALQALPRALSLFVGNVSAARAGLRRLDGQPDYNRVWPGADTSGTPEHEMMHRIVDEMRERQVFASIDIHNNTGLNPHYACINRLDRNYVHLATLFSRIAVYFRRPLGVQSEAFAKLCPAVTVECGKPGHISGEEHAAAYIDACLRLAEFPAHEVAKQDLDLFHSVATVRIPEAVSFGFGHALNGYDVLFDEALDHMNFRELAAGTKLGVVSDVCAKPLEVVDEEGEQVAEQFFDLRGNALVVRRPVMPAMLTLDERIIRQDCLCYLMERLPC